VDHESGVSLRELADRHDVSTHAMWKAVKGISYLSKSECKLTTSFKLREKISQVLELHASGMNKSQLAKKFNVSRASISKILSGRTYKDVR